MRRDKSPTISNKVAYAIEDIMANHLDDYLPRSLLKGVSFHHQSEEIHATDCPAILIFDNGSETLWETCRGVDDAGVLQDGMAMDRYRFDLLVWVKGRKRDDSLRDINKWRDGLKACFRDKYDLGGIAANVTFKSDDPTAPLEEGSATLRAVAIQLNVDVYHLQGAVIL